MLSGGGMVYGKSMLRRLECRLFAAEQFNGCEGAGRDFVIELRGFFRRTWGRFRAASSRPLDLFLFVDAKTIERRFA